MAHPETSSQWTLRPGHGLETLQLQANTPMPALQAHECLVKIEAVSLNYRDVAIARGTYPGTTKSDLVPGSDASGTIVAVGRGVQTLQVGDAVCALFMSTHRSGSLTLDHRKSALGSQHDGVLRQYAAFAEQALVRAPRTLTPRESAALPCAAVTAWNCLFGLEGRKLRGGDTVLVQGTGGVSLFALQFAVAVGAKVIATTSSDGKAARLKELGAAHVINYREDPNWGETAKGLTPGKHGAQHVIEVGGETSMAQSLKAVCIDGVVSIVGFLGGNAPAERCSFMDVLMTSAIVRGIYVGPGEQFEEMNEFIDRHAIRPVLDPTTFAFKDAPKALQYLGNAQHVGKIIVDVDGHHRV